MNDKDEAMQQALECIERLNKHGWILADFEAEVYAAITALKAALEQPDRRALQAAGTHPAPCARHCEAKAFEIEIRSLKSALKQAQPVQEPSEAALQALARRCLWIAYCWNDHNFKEAYTYARLTAQKHGVHNFDEANEWITAQPVQEPTQWRDMVVVSLVREGINKHRARELADHFATQPLPVQEAAACRFCFSEKGCWAWQCDSCGEIDDVQQPAPLPVQEPVGDEWTPCMKLPVVVHVRQQRPGESHVSTREGITPVKPDDLIMRGVSGEEYPIGRAIFEQTYSLDITPSQQQAEPPKLRRGDILRCIETDELCTVWATSTTGKTLIKWSANNFGNYTAEQIGELFWIEQQAKPMAWDKPSASFDEWWDGDRRRDNANPFQTDSFAYWAFEGWQAALAQPLQEPLAWLYPEGLKALQNGKCWTAYPTQHEDCNTPLYIAMPPMPVQEPVARVIDNGTPEGATEWIPFTNRVEPLETGDLLYTAPLKQRQPLAASEILNMMPGSIPAEYDGSLMEFARAIEAKLKEPDHG